MADGDKYIPNGVWLRCDKGTLPAQLIVLPKTVKLYGQDWASQFDARPIVNIPTFGVCAIIKACVPATVMWQGFQADVQLIGQSPILNTSTCPCTVGGTIKIYFTKQAVDAAGAEQAAKDNADLLGKIGMGLLVAGAVVGAGILIFGTGGAALPAVLAIVGTGALAGGVGGAVQGGITGGAEGAAKGFLMGSAFGAMGGLAVAAGGPAALLAGGAGLAGLGSVGFLGEAYYHNPSQENGLVLVGALGGLVAGYGTARVASPYVRTAVRNANVRQATPEQTARLAQTRTDLRLNSNRQRNRNMAIAEGEIEGRPYNGVAISGRNSPQGTVQTRPEGSARIRTSPTQRDIERGNGTPDRRAHDTEIKILEDVMGQTESNPNARGNVRITSELPICPSCYRAITSEFHRHRPNIRVEGVETQRPNVPDRLPGRQGPNTIPPMVPQPTERDDN